jgi:hypothetical protein
MAARAPGVSLPKVVLGYLVLGIEGRVLVEPEEGVAKAPYARDIGGEENGGRDAGFWVLIAIAIVTAVCVTYSLLIATGVF